MLCQFSLPLLPVFSWTNSLYLLKHPTKIIAPVHANRNRNLLQDFVIATGEQHTVRDFTEKAFAANGITIRWEGEGIDEKGYDAETGKMLVCVNPQWFRPTDVDNLWGDPTKAKTVLGWNPQKTSYEELVEIMAKHDRALAKKEAAMKNA